MLQDVLKKSFKEQTAETSGRSAADGLPSVGAAGVRGGVVVALRALLRRTSTRRSRGAAAHPGDRRDAGALWISADTDPAAAGRLARQSQADLPYLQGRGA
jgi:hypothetical protein